MVWTEVVQCWKLLLNAESLLRSMHANNGCATRKRSSILHIADYTAATPTPRTDAIPAEMTLTTFVTSTRRIPLTSPRQTVHASTHQPDAHLPTASPTTERKTPCQSSAPPPTSGPAAGTVRYGGANIAGFDFGSIGGCGNAPNPAYPPLQSLGGPDGIGQMK